MDVTKALEYVSDGVVGLDRDWSIRHANPRAEQLLRRPKTELVGQLWWDVAPYLVGTASEQSLRSAAERAEPMRLRIFHPPLYAWHDVWVIQTAEGVLLTIRDTTDIARMRQEESVREAVREVIDRAPVAISVLRGPEHRIELMNQLARRLLGGRDLEGRTVRNAIPEVEGQGLFEILDEVYRTGEPFEGTGVPIRYDRTGGGEMVESVFNVVYQPILDVTGKVSGVLSVSVDVGSGRTDP